MPSGPTRRSSSTRPAPQWPAGSSKDSGIAWRRCSGGRSCSAGQCGRRIQSLFTPRPSDRGRRQRRIPRIAELTPISRLIRVGWGLFEVRTDGPILVDHCDSISRSVAVSLNSFRSSPQHRSPEEMRHAGRTNRRDFIGSAAMGSVAFPTIVPATVFWNTRQGAAE